MAPLRFDKARIDGLLALAGEQLEGDWLLVGGAAAAAASGEAEAVSAEGHQHLSLGLKTAGST